MQAYPRASPGQWEQLFFLNHPHLRTSLDLWQQTGLIPDWASWWSGTLHLKLYEDYNKCMGTAGIHMSQPRTLRATSHCKSSTLDGCVSANCADT